MAANNKQIGATIVLRAGNFFANAKKASASLKGLKEKFNSSSKSADGMNRAFGSAASGTASLTKSLLGLSAIRKTVNLITDSVDSALERMDRITNFKRTMTAISGSADVANQSIETLKSVTKGTAYGLDVAASAVQNFTTRGMSIGESTSEVAKWADAVAFYGNGTNEALSTVTDALGKMLSKGTVEMEQQNRLTDNGINGAAIYAQATGRSVKTVLADLKKGNISSKDFITTVSKAFTEGTNGVLNISGAAKTAGGTWAATISNMKAAVTRGVVSITEKTNNALQSAGLGTIQDGIKKFGEKIESVLGKVGDKIGEFIGKAAPFITDKFMPALSGIANNWERLAPVIGGVVVAMLAYEGAMKVVTAAQTVLNAVMNLNPIGLIVAGIALVVTGLVLLYRKSETFRNFVNKVFSSIATFAKNTWNSIVTTLKPLVSAISNAFRQAWELIKVVWGYVKPYFKTIWEGIKLVFSVVKTSIGGFFGAAWALVKAQWSVAIGYFTAIFNAIAGIFSAVKSVLSGDWQGAWDAIRGIVGGWVSFFKGIWESIKQVFSSVGSWFSGVFTAAGNAVKRIFNGILGLINKKISGTADLLNKLIDGVNKITGAIGIPAIPHITAPQIPMLANGGVIRHPGSVLVGERGPEVLRLPRGASVAPLPAGAGGGTYYNTFHVTVNADDDRAAERFVKKVKQILDNM